MAKLDYNKRRHIFANEVHQQRVTQNEEYDLKYRTFLLYKWEILKQIKAKMLSEKQAEIKKSKGLCRLLVTGRAL